MLKNLMIPAFAALCVSFGMPAVHAEEAPAAAEAPAAVPQTKCPLMGEEIDKEAFVDYKGKRIYFCCNGCDKKFLKDADAIIAKQEAAGVVFEKTPTKDVAEAAVDGMEVKVEAPKPEGSHKNKEGSHKK